MRKGNAKNQDYTDLLNYLNFFSYVLDSQKTLMTTDKPHFVYAYALYRPPSLTQSFFLACLQIMFAYT